MAYKKLLLGFINIFHNGAKFIIMRKRRNEIDINLKVKDLF